jgi:hypothetical protein
LGQVAVVAAPCAKLDFFVFTIKISEAYGITDTPSAFHQQQQVP